MSYARKLLKQWSQNPPREVDLQDLLLVIRYFLGEDHIFEGGKHPFRVAGPKVTQAYHELESRAARGGRPNPVSGPTVAVSAIGGRRVKGYIVRQVVALIEVSAAADAK